VQRLNNLKGDKVMHDTHSFLDFVLKGHHHDSKTDSYVKEVDRILNLGLNHKEETRRLTNESVARVDIDTTGWDGVASKTLLHQLYTRSAELRDYHAGYTYNDSFYDLIVMLVEKGLYGSFLLEMYTEEEIEEIGSYIDPSKDELFSYVGLRMLADKYLAKDFDGNVYELPQERWLIIAMTTMRNEVNNRLEYIKEAYWALSNLYMTVATPTMANSGKTHGQLSSCFIDTVGDSLDGIYLDNYDTARVSKGGGGVGIYMGKVRALNSSIKGFKNKASGVIPWIRNLNGTAISVDQLGQRQGAIAIYLDLWHKDILSFLDIGTNNGDERLKARDIFPGICVPDYFMELIEADETGRMLTPDATWYLFDPHEVRQVMGYSLEDSFDEEKGSGTWRTRYQECIDNPLLGRVEIPVKKMVQAILIAQLETGHPYMFYRDEVNRMNPNKHKGMVYCSNLCTEIAQNMSPTPLQDEYVVDGDVIIMERKSGDYVVCNLSSISLARAYRDDVIARLVKIQVRMLDNVIDVNTLPLPQARITNKKYRPIGLGTFGWHHILADNGIDWDSERSIEFADTLYEEIAYNTILASVELAEEKGAYPTFEGSDWNTGAYFEKRQYVSEGSRFDWDGLKERASKGIRNGHLMAVAPNASTALIANSTQGIDPFYGANGIYFEEKKDFKIPVVAPDLSPRTFAYYYKRNAHHVNPEISILQNAKRQRHIDQAISFNLYVPSDIKGKDLIELHRKVWRNGIKTSYYVRGTANELADDCDSCQ
jgi:ribonucleoside-diphosphate reductase alpha chain